jgi:DNA-binding XRE family transcriptional regulator
VDIYNRIAVFRAERGTSRRELADAVAVNPQTIGYLERGDYNPSLELAMKIAAFFDVAVDHLFSFQPFESVAAALRRADAQGMASTTPTAPAEPIAVAAHQGDS